MKEKTAPKASGARRRPITIERTYDAAPEEVWEMWTTKEGIEAWWGPERFTSTVLRLEARVGGRLEIEMATTDPEIVAYLQSQGQKAVSVENMTFTEVQPFTRLAFLDHFNHAPELEPYDVTCVVTLEPVEGGTKMTFTGEAMHDEHWTELATMGWNQQFEKLAVALERRAH